MLSNVGRLFLIIVVLLVLDGVYLSLNMSSYSQVLSQIQNAPININFLGAFMAYAALIIATYVLTTPGSNLEIPWIDMLPKLDPRIYATTLIFFLIYLCYNGTTLATFSDYILPIAIRDTLWGTLLGFITSCIIVFFS